LDNLRSLHWKFSKPLTFYGICELCEFRERETNTFRRWTEQKYSFTQKGEATKCEDQGNGSKSDFRRRKCPETTSSDGKHKINRSPARVVFQVAGKILQDEFTKIHGAASRSRRAYYEITWESSMSPRIWLKLGEIIVPILLAIIIFVSWQADRRDRAALAAQLAAAQKTIADATASQHNRDTLLNQTLAQINDQKQATLTTAQILNSLQAAMSLPSPITQKTNSSPTTLPASLSASATSQQSSSSATNLSSQLPNNPTPKPAQSPQTDATLPAADLKPLYDFALDCKACQAKLTASQSDLADEKTKTAALIKERDAALTAAKGGSTLRRIARAAKWFAIGAAAGAVAALAAAKTSH
jgi:hypothetical protein